MIQWYVYAILAAVFASAFSITRKKALSLEHAMNFESARVLSVALFSLILIPVIKPNIDISTLFLVYCASLLGAIGIVFASKAFRHGEISLIAPLENIKPSFVLILAYFFLAETPSVGQLIGIIILFISAYLLEADQHIDQLLKPVKNLLRDKYGLYFVFAIFLFSVCSLLDRYIVSNRLDVFTYLLIFWVFVAINFNFIHGVIFGFKEVTTCFKKLKLYIFLVAFFSFLANILELKALSMAYVSLVIPVLMLSTLFVVAVGGKFFHEKNLLFRLIVSLLMLMGTVMVVVL